MSLIRKILASILLIIISLTIALLLGEGLVRGLYGQLKNYNLEMWRYAKDLKQPLPMENLPFHHYPNRRGRYYGVEIRTNGRGFRDYDYSLKKKEEITRIMLIGDSFTLGWGVAFENTYSKQLEKQLNEGGFPCEVINTGIGNYNSIMEVELFKEKGLPYEPDVAILMYFVNDAEPVPSRSSLEYSFISKSYLFALLSDRLQGLKLKTDTSFNWKNYYASLYDPSAPALQKNRTALEELIHTCQQEDIQLLFVNIPELHQLHPYPFPFITNHIRNIALSGSVPFLDLLPYISDRDPESLWVSPEDSHANELANKIFSLAIMEKLIELGYLEH